MKILYITPEHISGTLPILCEGHRNRGNYARYLTLFSSPFGFAEDLALNLRLQPDMGWILQGRKMLQKLRGFDFDKEREGNPPWWEAGSWAERAFFRLRDGINAGKVKNFIDENGLNDYDLYHLEQGLGIFRDCRQMKKWKAEGKKFACFYHGNDVRNRGVLREIHEISDLNLTSELDLLEKYPGIKYLFLPFDTNRVQPIKRDNEKIKIVHATRSRHNKGSDFIIDTVKELAKSYPVEMVLIENLPHTACMVMKAGCDICIDQIADKGGWGYGMSSVESLAQGTATCTYLNNKYLKFIPDHAFVNVNYDNLKSQLIKLIESKDYRLEMSEKGRDWVVKYHSVDAVMRQLYGYYEEAGIV